VKRETDTTQSPFHYSNLCPKPWLLLTGGALMSLLCLLWKVQNWHCH